MRERRETPEPWAGAMSRAEIRSLNHLAELTGVAVQTLTRLVHGEGEPADATLAKVAGALRPQDARRVSEWAHRAPQVDLTLPEAARRLTPKQWAAVVAVINSMANPGEAAQPDASVSSLRPTQPDNLESLAARREQDPRKKK